MVLIPTTPPGVRRDVRGTPTPLSGTSQRLRYGPGVLDPLRGAAGGASGGPELPAPDQASRPLRGSAGGVFQIPVRFFLPCKQRGNSGSGEVFSGGGLTLHDAMPYLGKRQPIRGSYGASRFTP